MKGLGLIEIIIGIFIITLLLIASLKMQQFVEDSARFSFEEMQAVEEARAGIDLMVRQIRETKDAGNGSYPIALADDQQFIFYADIDNDDKVEKIRYFLDGAELKKGTIEPLGTRPVSYPDDQEKIAVIASYIRNGTAPIFYFYNGDWPLVKEGNPLGTPTRLIETKYMRVFLRINVNPGKTPGDFELSSGTQLRNLKSNL